MGARKRRQLVPANERTWTNACAHARTHTRTRTRTRTRTHTHARDARPARRTRSAAAGTGAPLGIALGSARTGRSDPSRWRC